MSPNERLASIFSGPGAYATLPPDTPQLRPDYAEARSWEPSWRDVFQSPDLYTRQGSARLAHSGNILAANPYPAAIPGVVLQYPQDH